MWDLFVSHASEDKEEVVRPLIAALRKENPELRIWYDEFTLRLGDRLREKIDHGLANSRFGVVVLSPTFLAKKWPLDELEGLFAKEVNGRPIILPIWHGISRRDLMSISPMLANRVAARTDSWPGDRCVRYH